jgi:hypothetical protein
MKTEIVGMLVMTLLITTAAPVFGYMNHNCDLGQDNDFGILSRGEVLDQYQEDGFNYIFIHDGGKWQSFVPTMSDLVRVEVLLERNSIETGDIILSIERPLGNILGYDILTASQMPPDQWLWVSFDVKAVLAPGFTYCIVLTSVNEFSDYYWRFDTYGHYPYGEASVNPYADFTFRTWAENEPPMAVLMDGPGVGRVGAHIDFEFVTTDPDEDPVYYYVDWGDRDGEWFGPYDSGETVTLSHTWAVEDTYLIMAKARDVHDEESDWSELEISIPRSRLMISDSLIRCLFERFPPFRQILALMT